MQSKLFTLVCAATTGGLLLLTAPAAADEYTYEYEYDYYEPTLPPAMTEPSIVPTITDVETPPTAQGDFVTDGDFGRLQADIKI